jgi:hypothetical protein
MSGIECEFSPKPAARRYRRDFAIGMGLYVIAIVAVVYVLNRYDAPAWLAVVLALLPVAPVLFAFRAYVVFLSAADEFQRRIQHESILIAATIVAFASLAYGLLEEMANFPHVPLIWVMPAMSVAFGVTTFFVARRYR